MLGVVIIFGIVASASLLSLEYAVGGSAWAPYGSPVEIIAGGGSNDLSGDIVGKISEDPVFLAETMWADIIDTRASFLRMKARVDGSSESVSSIDLTEVGSEYTLAKILSNIEVVMATDWDERVVSVSLRVPASQDWPSLSASRTRAGTIWIKRPLVSAAVIEEPPRYLTIAGDLDSISAELPVVKEEPSFVRKYWFWILGGVMIMNAFTKNAAAPPAAAPVAPAAPQPTTGHNKRK